MPKVRNNRRRHLSRPRRGRRSWRELSQWDDTRSSAEAWGICLSSAHVRVGRQGGVSASCAAFCGLQELAIVVWFHHAATYSSLKMVAREERGGAAPLCLAACGVGEANVTGGPLPLPNCVLGGTLQERPIPAGRVRGSRSVPPARTLFLPYHIPAAALAQRACNGLSMGVRLHRTARQLDSVIMPNSAVCMSFFWGHIHVFNGKT